METLHIRGRGRGAAINGTSRPHSRNKHWTPADATPRNGANVGGHSDGERWERGGHRGGGRGRGAGRGTPRKFPNVSLRVQHDTKGKERATPDEPEDQVMQDEEYHEEPEMEQDTNTTEDPVEWPTEAERKAFYEELERERAEEKRRAIAEGKMDNPDVPRRLEDAITKVGTCLDMCPRYERYRRQLTNNLFVWETIPGTKKVDHKRAVKSYERAAGDKVLPSDLRPPHVLKHTLDYLFHDLLPRGGFIKTHDFIRDRSRAVRNDFTMQHETGPTAIECHDRCARFHILALHFQRDQQGFSPALEEQQLMNTLQSLKELYEDQRGRYESPNELEMRVYHRLIHIRDQKERHEDIPEHITSHPVFKLTTDFRVHVQKKSAPITKISALVVDDEAMQIFGQLVGVLREQGNVVMIYLVACILERLFGKDCIDDIEALRGDMSISEVIDGGGSITEVEHEVEEEMADELDGEYEETQPNTQPLDETPAPSQPSTTHGFAGFASQPSVSTTSVPATSGSSASTAPPPAAGSAFRTLTAAPNPFGSASVFGGPAFGAPSSSSGSVFGAAQPEQPKPIFGSFTIPSAPAPAPKAPTPPPAVSSAPPAAPAPVTNGAFFNIFGGAAPASAPSLPPAPSVPTSSSAPPNGNIFGSFPKSSSSAPTSTSWGISPPTKTEEPSTQATSAPAPKPVLNPKAPSFTPTHLPSSPFTFAQPSKPTLPSTPPVANEGSTAADEPPPYTPAPPVSFVKSSSPSTGRNSATPPLNLKIDTNVQVNQVKPPAVASPANPPPLQRVQPISLPSTPTVRDGPFLNPMIDHLKGSLLDIPSPSLSRTNTEILSPLVISSPSTSFFGNMNNFTPKGTPQAKRIRTEQLRHEPSFPSLLSGINGKGKAPAPDVPVAPDPEDTKKDKETKVARFIKKHEMAVVKECYKLWKKRVTDKAMWLEACLQSESYRRKIQGERISRTSSPDKKRRMSMSTASESVVKKRPRKKRPSEYQPPRTDEELARRLKENHEEHERRWAPGSFLQTVRSHVKGKLKAPPKLPWSIWLSMNPDSDATAIWLERKFDVPGSGSWVSDTVFSIPLTPATSAVDPGLIFFECSPIEGISDDIERKYRILDDCSRLRDIIKSLPTKRRFIPSLLILCWTDGEKAYEGTDFIDMVKKLVNDSTIESYHILPMTIAMRDPDGVLEKCLPSLSFDIEGKLAQNLTVRGVFKKFDRTISSFVTEWIDNCNFNGNFNWAMYCRVVQASLALLNKAGECSFELLGLPKEALLQKFDIVPVGSSDAVYELVEEWLSNINEGGDTETIILDIESHRNINQEFPVRAFIDHLSELLQLRLGRKAGKDLKTIYYVPVADITSAVAAFKESIQPLQLSLSQTLSLSVRRSPKRRGASADTDRLSPGAKRMKLSYSTSSVSSSAYEEISPPSSPLQANGRNTPSPSMSTVSLATNATSTTTTETPNISVAMLRALTKDLKRKYVSGTS